MNITKQNRNTWLFLGFLLMAGIANVLSRVFSPVWASLLTALNYVILTGLLLFWIQSVRVRLLPSAARTYILCAAVLMLVYMLIRIFKYRFAVEPVMFRYGVYAYWIPQMLIPALFLMTCIAISRGEKRGKWDPVLLLIPACILGITVMTNDLHCLVYVPKTPITQSSLDTGTYTLGPVFYLLYAWMILTALSGIVMTFRVFGRVQKKAVWQLLAVLLLWAGLVFLNILVLEKLPVPISPFKVPDTHIFGMLGFIEVCIRHRLIPYNENYSVFFRSLQLPILITDRELQPVYRTKKELTAEGETLRAALTAPVDLPEDQTLHGKEIRAGYAFWTEDESGVRRAQERLQEANETIEQENDLIHAETEQKEKDAYLQSRHRIYHEIAEELYPVQKQISRLLDSAKPGTDGFRETIAKVSVLNAYVKRKTNLLLLASEKDRLSTGELALALNESAYYLTLMGLQTTAYIPEDVPLSADRIVALYDTFEGLAEQLTGKASSLMVSWNSGGLRLAAETDQVPGTEGMPLPVRCRKSEGILYIDILSGTEAAL